MPEPFQQEELGDWHWKKFVTPEFPGTDELFKILPVLVKPACSKMRVAR
jgi:hypothetical protein